MLDNLCRKCGAELSPGQAFCPICGNPVPRKSVCGRCGLELSEYQEFCPQCGQKRGFTEFSNNPVPYPGQNFGPYATPGTEEKKTSKKKILAISIPAAVAVIALILFLLIPRGGVKGKYVYVSGSSNSYYSFEDGRYTYHNDDGNEYGSYTDDKTEIVLTDSDGKSSIMFVYGNGKYVFSSKVHYDNAINDGKTVNQTLKKSSSTTYKGYPLTLTLTLQLKEDGTFIYKLSMTYAGYKVGNDVVQNGTYVRDGDFLKLTESGSSEELIYIIKDNYVYDNVYMQEK